MTDLARHWAALPQISNIHASADGTWAFWCMAGPHETEEVYAAPIDGASAPQRLTEGADHYLIRDVSADGSRPDGGWLAEAYDAGAPHQIVRILPDETCLARTAAFLDRAFAGGGR